MSSRVPLTVVMAVLGALGTGNLYFIQRLVVKIDKVDDIATSQAGTVQQIATLQSEVKSLSDRVQDVTELKARVAVLEFALNSGMKLKPIKGER